MSSCLADEKQRMRMEKKEKDQWIDDLFNSSFLE